MSDKLGFSTAKGFHGKVPFAEHADKATNAEHADKATNADNATNATNADVAETLNFWFTEDFGATVNSSRFVMPSGFSSSTLYAIWSSGNEVIGFLFYNALNSLAVLFGNYRLNFEIDEKGDGELMGKIETIDGSATNINTRLYFRALGEFDGNIA
jgi:hypothetical protein